MSYYRPSFSQTVAMTRGRGFSSSYRGSSGRNSWGPSDRGRGSGYGSSSRGSANSGRFSSSYGGHSMDNRNKYPSSSERYSGGMARGNYDDYKSSSYRQDLSGSGFSSRESHRSPERKRPRGEAPSSHRGHEGDSFNSSSTRYQPNNFNESRSFSRDRRTSSFSRREDFRKPTGPATGSPRGGYRGRISSRGARGGRLMIRDGPPRRRLVESSYSIRKRLAPRMSLDYRRTLKTSRIRSIGIRRPIRHRPLSDKEDSDEKEKESDTPGKKSGDEGPILGEDSKQSEVSIKSPKKEPADKEEKQAESDSEEKTPKKTFIKLVCPHCNSKYITFGRYSMHLHSGRHMAAMRQVALKQKAILARMRLSQRNAQRELEKTADDLAPRTNFCPLCKLNYRQPKSTHQASDCHKSMKKFLMPYCKICRITLKSPMLYESHICSIEHIKRKSRVELNGEKSEREEGSANEEDNLENFMTIDSVGDVDDEEAKKKEVEEKPKEQINVGIEQIRKIEVHYCELCRMYLPRVEEGNELGRILAKHCKQRTHMQRYIRYKEDKEIANRAERLQRKETAEKEREKNKIKEDSKENETTEKSPKTDKIVSNEDEENIDDKLWADDVNKDLGDILAEAESGNKSSDEDEDSHAPGERYDRFRYSEKNGEEKDVAESKSDKMETNELEEKTDE